MHGIVDALTSPRSAAFDDLNPAHAKRLVWAALLVLFSYVFLANAWLGDDAHITFRVIWNFVHGFGLRFNPDERVQAFTHPLWTLLLAPLHAITGEFYATVTASSWLLCAAAGVVVVRRQRSLAHGALLVAWLLTSKAFVDYTSSGLEYPLSFLLLAIFYTRYLDGDPAQPVAPPELGGFVLLGALGFLNRPDTALLYVVPLAEMTLRTTVSSPRRVVRPVVLGSAPALAWLAFATFYYGFPLPNTFYAKAANGIPGWLMHEQGLAYLANSLRFDPVTVSSIALVVAAAWTTRGATRRAALSAALYVAYAVWVGGDFMSGRFFAMPFFLAVITLMGVVPRRLTPWFGAALLLYNLVVPIVPIKTGADYAGAWPWRTQNGVKDERGNWHLDSNPLGFSPFRRMLDTPFAREGLSFRASDRKVSVYCCIGLYGLTAGPGKHVIDENALSDPLLAHLPVSPRLYFDFWASHYFRDLPDGYVASVEADANLVADPLLHEYYDRIRRVTRAPLTDASRLRDIWALNLGRDRDIAARFERRREVALSFRADHARFQTDVGTRDIVAGTLATTGRSGYLQLGPGIPVKPGSYRAQWRGTTTDVPGTPIGYVEVWNGETRIARERLASPEPGTAHTLAHVDFTLSQPARHLDYRLWVSSGARVTLERVELYSATAVPRD